jgi:hypothetical protein
MKKYSKKELIDIFNTKYKELGRIPNRDEIGYRQPIKRLYGGYNNFLRELGHLPNYLRTKEDYIKYVQKLNKELKKIPSLNDLEDRGVYRLSIYKLFGNYNNLLDLAGFENRRKTYTNKENEELLSDYIELCNKLERWATTRELKSIDIYENRFGSIIEVRKLVVNDERLKIKDKVIEKPFNRKYSDEQIKEYIDKAMKKYGKEVTKTEMVEFLKNIKGPSINTIMKRYKTTSFKKMIKIHIGEN